MPLLLLTETALLLICVLLIKRIPRNIALVISTTLVSFSIIVTTILMFLTIWLSPNSRQSARDGLLLAVILLIAVIALALFIRPHLLMRRGGLVFILEMGLLLAIDMGGVIIVGAWLVTTSHTLSNGWTPIAFCGGLGLIIIDMVLVLFFNLCLVLTVVSQLSPFNQPVDWMIILGAGITATTVSPRLKSRLDLALKYVHAHNPNAQFIVSGGQGVDEPISEAQAMRDYLIQQGVSPTQIQMEDQSHTTAENMRFSQALIKAQTTTEQPDIVFATSNYHVLRGRLLARQTGLNVQGIGAPTTLPYLPAAMLREFAGILLLCKRWVVAGLVMSLGLSLVTTLFVFLGGVG